MALDSYRYGDPAKVAEINEARELRTGCNGCVYRMTLWGIPLCVKHTGIAGSKLQKCRDYNDGRKNGDC